MLLTLFQFKINISEQSLTSISRYVLYHVQHSLLHICRGSLVIRNINVTACYQYEFSYSNTYSLLKFMSISHQISSNALTDRVYTVAIMLTIKFQTAVYVNVRCISETVCMCSILYEFASDTNVLISNSIMKQILHLFF